MANVTYPSQREIDRLNNVSMLVAEPLAVVKVSETVVSLTFTLPAEDATVHIAL